MNMIHHIDTSAASPVACNWPLLRRQLLDQWKRLGEWELDEAGPNCRRLAGLIQQKYGIAMELVESYLHNLERTMPLLHEA
jgi:hypothetical protein